MDGDLTFRPLWEEITRRRDDTT